ncbi:MAG TPA: glycosyltransferase [Pseudobdellovibrionaceae bacterium]|nr:glycosyltransferase [Pseudobdellovibrionaceae bacterium]
MASGWEVLSWSVFQSLCGLIALLALTHRSRKRGQASQSKLATNLNLSHVSVIVPARNEAENLRRLLPSLFRGEGAQLEVMVVDDHSQDATASVAVQLGAKVIPAGTRPEGWTGKSWACQVGAQAVSREVLLFIDADTLQNPAAIRALLPHLEQASLVSAAPFHLNPTWWEKLLGPFQILIMLGCAVQGGDRYAIGQFMMFRRSTYEQIGGHARVRETICEDLALAQLVRDAEARGELQHGVWSDFSGDVYKVRMYESFAQFWSGWRRLMRLGLKRSSMLGGLAVYAVIANLTLGFAPLHANALVAALSVGGWILTLRLQQRWGEFSPLGFLAFPFTLLLFAILSGVAIVDQIFRRDFVWRGRRYSWQVS